MLHLSPNQYHFLLKCFEERTFGLREDLDTDIEVIGAGLDASLQVGAFGYEHPLYGYAYAFYRIELLTFVNEGEAIPNDFDPQRFIELYRQQR